jgi:hypothetical protein
MLPQSRQSFRWAFQIERFARSLATLLPTIDADHIDHSPERRTAGILDGQTRKASPLITDERAGLASNDGIQTKGALNKSHEEISRSSIRSGNANGIPEFIRALLIQIFTQDLLGQYVIGPTGLGSRDGLGQDIPPFPTSVVYRPEFERPQTGARTCPLLTDFSPSREVRVHWFSHALTPDVKPEISPQYAARLQTREGPFKP